MSPVFSCPPEQYFSLIEPGTILYFVNDEADSPESHPHIVILKDTSNKYLLCMCTSRVTRRMEIFEKLEKDFATLVIIQPDGSNGLTKETAVDCNNYFHLPESILFDKFTNGVLSTKGTLQPEYLEQIINGLLLSDEIEGEIKELLNLYYSKS
jgi:hypothetical protein